MGAGGWEGEVGDLAVVEFGANLTGLAGAPVEEEMEGRLTRNEAGNWEMSGEEPREDKLEAPGAIAGTLLLVVSNNVRLVVVLLPVAWLVIGRVANPVDVLEVIRPAEGVGKAIVLWLPLCDGCCDTLAGRLGTVDGLCFGGERISPAVIGIPCTLGCAIVPSRFNDQPTGGVFRPFTARFPVPAILNPSPFVPPIGALLGF